MKNQFVRASAIVMFAIIMFISAAHADPKYIVRVNIDEGASYTYIPTDDGTFSWDYSVDGIGLTSADPSISEEHEIHIDYWVKQSLWAGYYTITQTWSGNVQAYQPGPYNYGATAYFPTPISYAVSLDDPVDGAFQCGSGGDAYQCTIPINIQEQFLKSSSNPTTTFAAYPSTTYQLVGGQASKYIGESRHCDLRYPPCNSTPWSADVNASATVNLTGDVQDGPDLSFGNKPGKNPGPSLPLQCGDDDSNAGGPGVDDSNPFSAGVNEATANLEITAEDPVVTRGYPLKNRIHINSQRIETARSMGNATFTYDMHVFTPSMNGHSRWQIIDGDGQVIDFGAGSSPSPGVGVFSSLATSGSGFALTAASSPENLKSAGNFSYNFDSGGKLVSIYDPNGNEQEISYSSGEISTVTDDSSLKTITFTWTSGKISKVTENGGGYTSLTYDGNGNLNSITLKNSSGTTAKSLAFTYDSGNGNLLTMTRDGNSSSTYSFGYEWKNATRLVMVAASANDSSSMLYGVKSPVSGAYMRTIVTNNKGGEVYHDLNSNFDVIQTSYPVVTGSSSPVVYSMAYDSHRNMTSWSDGSTTLTYDYETNGLLHQINKPGSRYTQYNWSGADLTSIADSVGALYTLGYTNMSLPHAPTTITDASSNVWTISRNSYGQVTEVTPPTGSQIGAFQYTYDETSADAAYGWMTKITDPLSNETRFDSFDTSGEATAISTDPDPSTPSTRISEYYAYDGAHRLTSETHNDSTSISYAHTGAQLTSVTDEASKETDFTYCPSCLTLQSITAPLSHTLKWNRDDDRDLTSFVDALSNVTNYTNGLASELTKITYPDSSTEQFQYDGSFRPKSKENARSQFIDYSYDTSGRTEEISFPTTSETSHDFTYLDDDSLSTYSDDVGTTTFSYYDTRLVQEVAYDYSSSGLTNTQHVQYEYYPDNLLKKITWKDGTTTVGTWDYTYDAAGRMASVTSFSEETDYTRDGQGKILTQSNANGTTTTYTWNDSRGWPTDIQTKHSTTTLADYALTYDSSSNTVGNITGVTEHSGDTLSYGYDNLYRLTSEARTGTGSYSHGYTYDLAGNLTSLDSSSFASYDAANKISSLSGSGASATYDSDGNITTLTGAGVVSSAFDWNARSQLISATTGGTTLTFDYDAKHRRVMQSDGTNTTFFIFAGDRLLGEVKNGSPVAAYTWGANGLVSERLFGAGSGGSDISLWYIFGPQGETRYLTDSSASIADSYTYDAYGNPLSATNNYYNPHRYEGRFGYHSNLNGAGLMLAGARWYSPNLRRWISRDPLRYKAGENLQSYVTERPTFFADPDGTTPIAISQLPELIIGGGEAIGGGLTLGGGAAAAGGIIIGGGILAVGECLYEPWLCKHAFQQCTGETQKNEMATSSHLECFQQYDKDREACRSVPINEQEQCYESARANYRACLGKVPISDY